MGRRIKRAPVFTLGHERGDPEAPMRRLHATVPCAHAEKACEFCSPARASALTKRNPMPLRPRSRYAPNPFRRRRREPPKTRGLQLHAAIAAAAPPVRTGVDKVAREVLASGAVS